MVQFGGRLFEGYHHLVALADEAVLQVGQLLVWQHRSSLCSIDVVQNHLLIIRKLILACRSLCRLLRLWVEFIDDVTIGVALYDLTICIRHHDDRVVRLPFLTVEAQIGLQTSLVAVRTLLGEGLDERLRQCLCKEGQFVDVTLHGIGAVLCLCTAGGCVAACTDERIAAADATQIVSLEGSAQLLINVDVSHVVGTVHRHGVMVPLVVAPVAWNLDGEAVRTIHQLVALESEVELVLGTVVLLQTAAVRDQRATTLFVSLEPEHQRVVLLLRAIQSRWSQLHALVCLL